MEWGNIERVQAVQYALSALPHEQTAVGMGFKLTHDPARCVRCRANIAILEISSILSVLVDNQVLSEVSL